MKTKYVCADELELSFVYRAKSGDYAAFEQLVATKRDHLYRQAYRKLKNVEDAHDAVQEALVKAFRAMGSFDPNRPLLPWLQRICSNCCVDILRYRKHMTENLDDHEFGLRDPDADAHERAESHLLAQQIQQALLRLPIRYKRIVQMRHFQHMDVNEIAASLGKPEGTIKSWLFRARELLRKELETAAAGA